MFRVYQEATFSNIFFISQFLLLYCFFVAWTGLTQVFKEKINFVKIFLIIEF